MSVAPASFFLLLLAGWLQVPEPPQPADDVQWFAPPGCPDRDALLAGIARRRGQALAPGQARVIARAIAVGPRRYRLDLELDVGGRHEARVLTARTCTALVDALALRIALALDASAREAPADPPDPADPPAVSPTAPVDPPVPPAVSPVSPADPPLSPAVSPLPPTSPPGPPVPALEFAPLPPTPTRPGAVPGGFLRLHGLGELGALPGPTGGVGLAGGLLWPRFRLELDASYLAPRALDRPQARVRASLFAGAVLGCARLGRGVLELPLCGGLELGGMPGAGQGPGVRATALGRWLAVTVGLGAAVRVHPRIHLWTAVQGLFAVQRSTFVLRDPELILFDPGVVSARLALGVELRLRDPR